MKDLKIGFLVNPIAGMGGKVALKGTDGQEILEKAIRLGAAQISPERACEFLRNYVRLASRCDLMTPPGVMGEELAKKTKVPRYTVLEISLASPTTSEDTRNVVRALEAVPVDLIVFVGGDGTSVDVLLAASGDIPVLGIPSGVKTYGEVFAHSPQEGAEIVQHFLDEPRTRSADVIDLDEAAYRSGRLDITLKGQLLVPDFPRFLQSAKSPSQDVFDEQSNLERISEFLEALMQAESEKSAFIVGPGSTFNHLAMRLRVPRTLLGVDIIQHRRIVLLDAREDQLLDICKAEKCFLIITPIGGLGYLFGRGNHQISSRVLRGIPRERIWVVASKAKTSRLPDGVLRVDTQDPEVDAILSGFIRVIVDRNEYQMVKVVF